MKKKKIERKLLTGIIMSDMVRNMTADMEI